MKLNNVLIWHRRSAVEMLRTW